MTLATTTIDLVPEKRNHIVENLVHFLKTDVCL
jgi:hypothetical protein